MAAYALVAFAMTPRSSTYRSFFAAESPDGKAVGQGLLIGSIVITWLFAKSITNAADLGAKYGIVGAVAYAGWYLSIPVAGIVLYKLRTRYGVTSIAEFLTSRHGRAATLAFSLVILFRLFNEVWSNTAVVGAYFGDSGSAPYYSAAIVFAGLTLLYSARGGLRSSILTDALQLGLALFLLLFVLALIVPSAGIRPLLSSGEWTLAGGVDLLLVGLLQSFSYPFHDPVLTDRGFLTEPKKMLRGYLIAGAIAAGFIVLFGLVGVYAQVSGIDVAGQSSPMVVAKAFSVATLGGMTVLMMVSAGSTLDSTLSSFSRSVTVDLLQRAASDPRAVRIGQVTMLIAVVIGSLPLFAGTAILKATTVSGTMVLGLAPIFLLHRVQGAGRFAFHLALWPGVAVGIAYAAGAVPDAIAMGDGPYAALLGANVWGTVLVFAGFGLGWLIDRSTSPKTATATVAGGLLVLGLGVGSFGSVPKAYAAEPPAEGDETTDPSDNEGTELSEDSGLRLSGHAMLRLTVKSATPDRATPDRTSFEVYNLRLALRRDFDPVGFTAERRDRQSNLRSFSPSCVWLQQAYVLGRPHPGITLSTGLLYH